MIIKNGEYIAIDAVETDGITITGTGRPGDPLKLNGDLGKKYKGVDPIIVDNDNNTISIDNKTKEILNVWTKIPTPPIKEDNNIYGIQNGVWQKIDLESKANKIHKHNIEDINELDETIQGIYSEIDSKVNIEKGKGLSTNDYTTPEKIKLNNISEGATRVEQSEINGYIKINGKEVPIYKQKEITPAYTAIHVNDTDICATEDKTILTIKAGNNIILESHTAEEGGPLLKIAVDTTDIIDITPSIPTDTSMDSFVPTVKAIKDYIKYIEPKYNEDSGIINLTIT